MPKIGAGGKVLFFLEIEMNYLSLTFLSNFVSLAVVSLGHVALNGFGFSFELCMSAQLGADSLPVICSSASCSHYSQLLLPLQQNPRWVNETTSRPLYIVTPTQDSHVQASVVCSRDNGLQIRVRSGGHDYEGLSYRCDGPSTLIDLVNFRSIHVDMEEGTAWVQSGATLGELYYEIAEKSGVHGFSAGICPSVGVGGHFSGGGIGTMVRKHGLAADQIIDARMIDSNGRILDRRLMGEDLFWAIRGGGAASFGVILSWKVKLVEVPATVTVFTFSKSLDDPLSISLFDNWLNVGDNLPDDLFILAVIRNIGSRSEVMFKSLFLGLMGDLIRAMDRSFPELGLRPENCIEMSWIESTKYFAGYEAKDPLEVLLNRIMPYKGSFKAKSDFVQRPIPKDGLRKIWDMIKEDLGQVIMVPLGGKMNEVPSSDIPFPHRKGNRFEMQYMVKWCQGKGKDCLDDGGEKQLEWIRGLYDSMTPYVSRSPRTAYVNYRDLDLGTNGGANTSYADAIGWGRKYFGDNFERLVAVKTTVDPNNFFRNKQSIPSDVAFVKERHEHAT